MLKHALTIEFVLLPMFQAVEESIAIRGFEGHPRLGSGTQSGYHIDVAIVSRDREKWVEMGAQPVGRGQIDSMVSLTNIECSAVDLNTLQNLGNEDVGIGIAISMGVRRQIVGHEVRADRDVLGNWFAMISGDTGGKILGRF